MTTIALHQYLQKVEELIDDHQLDEAINHCRHILQQYPRHVDTYRTLVKAYLERGDYEEAVDLIQRILSTEPSDLIAHVASSVAFKEQSQFDQAIWHLERALDVEPYNAPLREELQELHRLRKTDVPGSVAPSSAALARIYLKSEMYNAAIVELRRALAQEPDRIDLKVLLAETLWWANKRVDAVSLSLEILDVLPNCIPVNSVLAEIWLQTGRVAEAQTYLKRLQAMTLVDKMHCDPETAVGRAFLTRGAPPLPDEFMIEQLGDGLLPEPEAETPVVATIDSDWIEEFSLEDTAELPEEEAENDGSDWLAEAALATGETFGTQPLVMPSDPLAAESNWFVAADEEEEESLDELLEDVGDDAQLDDWLAGLEDEKLGAAAEEPKEETTGFTGMLGGLLDSELEIVDDTAVSPDLTDLFEDVPEPQAEDADALDLAEIAELDLDQYLASEDDDTPLLEETETESIEDSFAEGLTALFSDMDDAGATAAESFEEATGDDIDLDEFLDSDLGMLAETNEPEAEAEPTGYTELFNELSTDAFPEEAEAVDSDWLSPTADDLMADLGEAAGDEGTPDWLAEVKDDEFEPVQIDPQLTSEWLTESDEFSPAAGETDESDWLAELAGDEPEADEVEESDWLAQLAGDEEEAETAVPPSQPPQSDELSDIPTWMLAGEQEVPLVEESPAPTDFAESTGFDTDELEEDTAVPTWLLGGDLTSEDTGTLDESAPLSGPTPPDSERSREKPQSVLAGEELPDWLREEQASDETEGAEPEAEITDPLATDSMANLASGDLPSWLVDDEPDLKARPIPEPDSELDIYKDDINIPDWLMADLSTDQDQAEVAVTDEQDEQEHIPSQEPESSPEASPQADDDDDLGWLEELAVSDDEPAEDLESASYASRVAAGEGGAVEEPPTQVSMPDELPDADLESADSDWLSQLGDSDREAAEESLPLDWSEAESEMDDVLAGVTGELNADLDWLDSLTEEESPVESPDDLFDDFDSGTGLLDDRIGDTGVLGEKPILPEFEDSLAALPEESDADLDWLSELEEEIESPEDLDEGSDEEPAGISAEADEDELEMAEVPADDSLEEAIETEPPEEIEDAMTWLEQLAAGQGAPLEELPGVTDTLATEPEMEVPEVPSDDSLDWLADMADESDIGDDESEMDLTTEMPAAEAEEPAMEDLEDIEDAMAWLEGLAAKQGARLEELPSMADAEAPESEPVDAAEPGAADDSLNWLDELTEEAVDDADILQGLGLEDEDLVVEADLDWLETEEEPEAEAPERAGEEEAAGDVAATAPDEPEDALVWLEALAAEQEASPEEQSDLMDETAVPDTAEPVSEEAFEESPADLDEAMGWLEDFAAQQESPLEDLPTIAGVIDEEPEAEPEPEEPVDALAEALDWLEQVALKDGGLPVDVPVRETAVSGQEDELTEALDWLEQLARSEQPADESVETAVDLTDLSDEMPEDPDEALAWLQKIAAEQEELETEAEVEVEPAADLLESLVVEEEDLAETEEPEATEVLEAEVEADLEATVEELSEAEIEDDILSEMPDDPDAAMAWLEKLAARQGAKLEELPSVSVEDLGEEPAITRAEADELEMAEESVDDSLEEAIETEPSQETESLAELPDVSGEILPEVTEDLPEPEIEAGNALDWLDEAVEEFDGESESVSELTDVDEATAAAPESDDTASDLPEADLAELEVPEDIDDAMAWLEALAAQQGAKLEELPTLAGTGELPPEVVADEDEETAVPEESIEAAGVEDQADEPDETDEVDTFAELSDEPQAVEAEATLFDEQYIDEEELSEGIDEALPDWLGEDTGSLEVLPGQTQWLRDLDEPDIGGWLDEEETTISSTHDRRVQSRYDTQSESVFDTGPLSSTADLQSDTGLFDLPEDEIESAVFSLDDDKLETAREAVKDNQFDEALQAYQTLVDAGGGMMTLIADLEAVATDNPDQPLFRHLLGDAYMRNGQLQKALDTYRVALDQI